MRTHLRTGRIVVRMQVIKLASSSIYGTVSLLIIDNNFTNPYSGLNFVTNGAYV